MEEGKIKNQIEKLIFSSQDVVEDIQEEMYEINKKGNRWAIVLKNIIGSIFFIFTLILLMFVIYNLYIQIANYGLTEVVDKVVSIKTVFLIFGAVLLFVIGIFIVGYETPIERKINKRLDLIDVLNEERMRLYGYKLLFEKIAEQENEEDTYYVEEVSEETYDSYIMDLQESENEDYVEDEIIEEVEITEEDEENKGEEM